MKKLGVKKGDIIIIIALIILSFIPQIVFFLTTYNKYNSLQVEIYSKGQLYKKVPLNKASEKLQFTVENELGINIIEIDHGQVKITDANCHDKVCVKSHAIDNPGETLICLPHKLVVKITGKGIQDTDEVSS